MIAFNFEYLYSARRLETNLYHMNLLMIIWLDFIVIL